MVSLPLYYRNHVPLYNSMIFFAQHNNPPSLRDKTGYRLGSLVGHRFSWLLDRRFRQPSLQLAGQAQCTAAKITEGEAHSQHLLRI